jgi:hypothetical protein
MKKESKILKYVALMQALYELSDDLDLKDSIFNTKIIKDRVFDLQNSLKKQIWRIYKDPKKDGIWKVDDMIRPEEWDRAVAQHNDIVQQMMLFFDIGMQMQELDEIKVQGFNTQLTILMKNYGIKVEDEV